jgi:tRNA uridine 5-carboxymethylaminomethyl modification enzyme
MTAGLPAEFAGLERSVKDEVVYRVAYKGYLERETRQIERLGQTEKIRIPNSINYLSISGLRNESRIKLAEMRPMTLGQASRISGVSPADISILMVWIEASRGGEGRKTSAEEPDLGRSEDPNPA